MDGIISVAIVSITFIYANSMGKTIHRGNLILIRIMAWVVVASLMYFFGSSLDKLLIYLGFPGLNHIFPDLMSPTERLSFVLTLFASLSISLSSYVEVFVDIDGEDKKQGIERRFGACAGLLYPCLWLIFWIAYLWYFRDVAAAHELAK